MRIGSVLGHAIKSTKFCGANTTSLDVKYGLRLVGNASKFSFDWLLKLCIKIISTLLY